MVGRRDLSDLERLLAISGHLLTFPKFTVFFKAVQIFRAALIPLLAPFALYAVYLGGIEGLNKYAFFSIAGILMSQHAIYFLNKESKIVDVIESFRKLLKNREETWQIEIFNKYSTTLWWLINLYLLSCVCFLSFSCIFPFLVEIYLVTFTKSGPFRLPTPAEPYLSGSQRSLGYYMIYTSGTLWNASLTIHAIGTECMCYTFSTYLSVELKVIRKKIENLGKLHYARRRNPECQEKLQEILKDHQQVLQLGTKVNDLLGFPLVCQNVISTMTITLLTYTASVQFRAGNVPVAFGAAFPLNGLLWMIFSVCYLGEMLKENSRQLSESLYELPWYEMDVGMRKDILMMLRQSSKPMVLDYKNSSSISLDTFRKMLNESYSYFMVLQSIS